MHARPALHYEVMAMTNPTPPSDRPTPPTTKPEHHPPVSTAQSSAALWREYEGDLGKDNIKMVTDKQNSLAAVPIDKDNLKDIANLYNKDGTLNKTVAKKLLDGLANPDPDKGDAAGDVRAGGDSIKKGKTDPTDMTGDDQKNAARDQKLLTDASKILNSGVGPDGKPLTDADRKFITDNMAPVAKDLKNSQDDVAKEAKFYADDQALEKDLKTALSGKPLTDDQKSKLQTDLDAVKADRTQDIANETTNYAPNDQLSATTSAAALAHFLKTGETTPPKPGDSHKTGTGRKPPPTHITMTPISGYN
jgi:hypothetical protein